MSQHDELEEMMQSLWNGNANTNFMRDVHGLKWNLEFIGEDTPQDD